MAPQSDHVDGDAVDEEEEVFVLQDCSALSRIAATGGKEAPDPNNLHPRRKWLRGLFRRPLRGGLGTIDGVGNDDGIKPASSSSGGSINVSAHGSNANSNIDVEHTVITSPNAQNTTPRPPRSRKTNASTPPAPDIPSTTPEQQRRRRTRSVDEKSMEGRRGKEELNNSTITSNSNITSNTDDDNKNADTSGERRHSSPRSRRRSQTKSVERKSERKSVERKPPPGPDRKSRSERRQDLSRQISESRNQSEADSQADTKDGNNNRLSRRSRHQRSESKPDRRRSERRSKSRSVGSGSDKQREAEREARRERLRESRSASRRALRNNSDHPGTDDERRERRRSKDRRVRSESRGASRNAARNAHRRTGRSRGRRESRQSILDQSKSSPRSRTEDEKVGHDGDSLAELLAAEGLPALISFANQCDMSTSQASLVSFGDDSYIQDLICQKERRKEDRKAELLDDALEEYQEILKERGIDEDEELFLRIYKRLQAETAASAREHDRKQDERLERELRLQKQRETSRQ